MSYQDAETGTHRVQALLSLNYVLIRAGWQIELFTANHHLSRQPAGSQGPTDERV